MKPYDITFIGHMCFDEITPYLGETRTAPGSAVLCGAMVAARVGKRVAAVVKMARQDESILLPMQQTGVETFLIPSEYTTFSRVIHPTADVDVRQLTLVRTAGKITQAELPPLTSRYVHLAGISNTEFDIELVRYLETTGCSLSLDMQSFVRQADAVTGEITFGDVPDKKELAARVDKLKLDVVEAKLLTGTADLEQAAALVESWGCPETVITCADGVLARANGKTYYERFSNSSTVGRTGRGDTTFAAYLAHRMDHDVPQALRFAAALVSVKMETPGPFCGTMQDVLTRMETKHRGKAEKSNVF